MKQLNEGGMKMEVVFRYSREQAIEDGVLIDAGVLAYEAGFRYSVALTAAAWNLCVAVPASCPWQDERGRLWDVLNGCVFRPGAERPKRSTVDHVASRVRPGRRSRAGDYGDAAGRRLRISEGDWRDVWRSPSGLFFRGFRCAKSPFRGESPRAIHPTQFDSLGMYLDGPR